MATTMIQVFAPMSVTATRASMICGNARMTSMVRIKTSSRTLREYAATRPTIAPSTSPIPAEMTATERIAQPPRRNRLSTSWPR
jgi:hypothetical protein